MIQKEIKLTWYQKRIKSMRTENPRLQLSESLLKRIDRVEQLLEGQLLPESKWKIAVFDLDNTLLEGDIGDALFVQLKQDEKKTPLTIHKETIPLTWAGYQHMLKNDGKKIAYSRVVTAMAGLKVSTIIETTRRVMTNRSTYLYADDEKIKVPRPNHIMKSLVTYLKQLKYEIFVISASNHYSVVYVARTYFGIPESHVFGMKPTIQKYNQDVDVVGNEIEEPGTVGEGKALTYQKFIGNKPPLITAGDSTTDLPILNLTHHLGLCIWVGHDEHVYERIRKKCRHPKTTFFLFRR